MTVAKPISNTAPGEPPIPGPQSEGTDAATFLAAIGGEVRRHRAKRGMTRRQLAQASLISERYLAQIESGAGNPSASVLHAIAQALDLPISALLPESGAHTAALDAILDLRQVPLRDQRRLRQLAARHAALGAMAPYFATDRGEERRGVGPFALRAGNGGLAGRLSYRLGHGHPLYAL